MFPSAGETSPHATGLNWIRGLSLVDWLYQLVATSFVATSFVCISFQLLDRHNKQKSLKHYKVENFDEEKQNIFTQRMKILHLTQSFFNISI